MDIITHRAVLRFSDGRITASRRACEGGDVRAARVALVLAAGALALAVPALALDVAVAVVLVAVRFVVTIVRGAPTQRPAQVRAAAQR